MRVCVAMLLLFSATLGWGQDKQGVGGAVEPPMAGDVTLQSFNLQALLAEAFWGAFESNKEVEVLQKRVEELTALNQEMTAQLKWAQTWMYWLRVAATIELFILIVAVVVAKMSVTVIGRTKSEDAE